MSILRSLLISLATVVVQGSFAADAPRASAQQPAGPLPRIARRPQGAHPLRAAALTAAIDPEVRATPVVGRPAPLVAGPGRHSPTSSSADEAAAGAIWQHPLPADDPEALSLPLLIDDVVARHPSLAAALAAWRATAARYPQVVSLDDPMLDLMLAPWSIGSQDVDFAYAVEGRQKIPWWGKRPLRGAIVRHESQALRFEAADTRVALVLLAKEAYFAYYLAARLLVLNAANVQALEEFRSNALRRYESNLVSRQDVLLAEVELAQQARRRLELERGHRIAIARINTLLIRDPLAPLPRAPNTLPLPGELLDSTSLRALALSQRPDLAAAAGRLRAEQAGVALAVREYKPDLELVARYDAFWQAPEDDLQGMVGLSLNVPVALARRQGAVREALARVSQRRAELVDLSARVQFEIEEAHAQVLESRATMRLFAQRLIPAAEASVESAEAGYVAGSVDFLRLIEAQRQLIALREGQSEALAELHRRWAALERVVAGPLVSPVEAVPPPDPQPDPPFGQAD